MDLGKTVKDAVLKQNMLAGQFNTIGVSEAITMGGQGLSPFWDISMATANSSRYEIFSTVSRNHCRQLGDSDMRSAP